MASQEIDPYMLTNFNVGLWWARRQDAEPGWRKDRFVRRPSTNIWYVESGRMTVSSGGKRTVFPPETLAFIPPDVTPTTWNDGPGMLRYLSLGCSLSVDGIDLFEGRSPVVLQHALPAELIRMWLQIHNLTRTVEGEPSLHVRLRLSAWVRELVAGLIEIAGIDLLERIHAIDVRVREAVEWMQMNLSKSPSIEGAAEFARVSPSHLRALFRTSLGMSWSEYLTRMRMHRAKQLLAGSRLPIAEIASIVGYSSSHHFSRAFSRRENIPPSQYRERLLP